MFLSYYLDVLTENRYSNENLILMKYDLLRLYNPTQMNALLGKLNVNCWKRRLLRCTVFSECYEFISALKCDLLKSVYLYEMRSVT